MRARDAASLESKHTPPAGHGALPRTASSRPWGAAPAARVRRLWGLSLALLIQACAPTDGGATTAGQAALTSPPVVFNGAYVTFGGQDPEGLIEQMEADVGQWAAAHPTSSVAHRLSVIQTYATWDSLSPLPDGGESAYAVANLARLWAEGRVPHVNFMWTAAASADAGPTAEETNNPTNPALVSGIERTAAGLARAMATRPGSRVLVTIGPEMNGSWTCYGAHPSGRCGAPGPPVCHATEFISIYRQATTAFRAAALDAGVAPGRMRFAWGPNTPRWQACDAGAYFPGWAYVDFIGYSHYSQCDDDSEDIVGTARTLFDEVGAPDAGITRRAIILQTGIGYEHPFEGGCRGGDAARKSWPHHLYQRSIDEPLIRGVVVFETDDPRFYCYDCQCSNQGGQGRALCATAYNTMRQMGLRFLTPRSCAWANNVCAADARQWIPPPLLECATELWGSPSYCDPRAPGGLTPLPGYAELVEARARPEVLDELGPVFDAQFWDLAPEHRAFDAVQWLFAEGATTGCAGPPASPPLFCPEGVLDRAQAVALLARLKYGASFHFSATPYFDDVPATHWAFSAVQRLAENGVTTGCGAGRFCPEQPTSRATGAALLARTKYGALSRAGVQTFTDVDGAHWASEEVERLAAEGIVTGCGGGRFCPDDALTRADWALMLHRARCLSPVCGGGPDAGGPDGGVADGGVADGGVADGGVADGGASEGGVADGGESAGGPAQGCGGCSALGPLGWAWVALAGLTRPRRRSR